jgi:hypothetical protein
MVLSEVAKIVALEIEEALANFLLGNLVLLRELLANPW